MDPLAIAHTPDQYLAFPIQHQQLPRLKMTLPPPLGRLCLASPENILRLEVVCTSRFRYSEHFIWERTAHDRHPRSTVTSFRHEVAEFIKNPEFIALVAVNAYDPDESSKPEAIKPVDNGWRPPPAGTPVVVGLGIWRLQPGSSRVGSIRMKRVGPYPELPDDNFKGLNQKRSKAFEDAAIEARSYSLTIVKWSVKLTGTNSDG
ncbi:Putative protein of unknown function [Podospora comata]|uniref:Uncharacterized protein n=1 Tax=Podospora comata TaxID=48703 RepID=A0ABY6SC50_PODCO|nr:Putative protein of unknown function [Podospora comata]